MWLQQSDPIFNIGVDVMRSAFNFEPKHRVTMLTREDWTKGTGPPAVRDCLVYGCVQEEEGGPGLESMGRKLSFSLVWYAKVFQAEIYAIMACVHEIKSHGRPEKHIFALIVSQP
jgi:hypothetical protein